MKKFDARKLSHKTHEEIRIRAVKQVQSGESPEVVIVGFHRVDLVNFTELTHPPFGPKGRDHF